LPPQRHPSAPSVCRAFRALRGSKRSCSKTVKTDHACCYTDHPITWLTSCERCKLLHAELATLSISRSIIIPSDPFHKDHYILGDQASLTSQQRVDKVYIQRFQQVSELGFQGVDRSQAFTKLFMVVKMLLYLSAIDAAARRSGLGTNVAELSSNPLFLSRWCCNEWVLPGVLICKINSSISRDDLTS
jgi:hypothetical protein